MVTWRIFHFYLIFCSFSTITCSKNAFISILSSDNFLLPAKVVAYRLQTINPSIPFVILATEDVSNSTINILKERDVDVIQIHKINSPYMSNHAGAKFQYTKIRLWSLIEYDALFHIDLDTLPMSDLAPAFNCGSFCATFRHSDKFNAGIFVMKPNMTVYTDLLDKVSKLESYDGGDQGFFNSYFDELKYAPMFNDKTPRVQKYEANIRRFSAAYNYDIGMYYLNGGHTLLEPKIVHFTLGPIKPWTWWTYPLFELNNLWLSERLQMEQLYKEPDAAKYLLLSGITVAAFMFAFREFVLFATQSVSRKEKITTCEYKYLPYVVTAFSLGLAFAITPGFAHPVPSWFFFSFSLVIFNFLISDIYITIRLGRTTGAMRLLCCMALCLTAIGSTWIVLAWVPTFGVRVCMTIPLALANIIFLSYLIRNVVLSNTLLQCTKYYMLPVTKDCVQ